LQCNETQSVFTQTFLNVEIMPFTPPKVLAALRATCRKLRLVPEATSNCLDRPQGPRGLKSNLQT
jgi:hypothetical protein